jgi:inner membrane protein
VYFFLLTASHGLLDSLTSGGLGIALWAPFADTRYFFPVTPIQVSPLSVRAFFSSWGVKVLVSEFVWVWIPLIGFVTAAKIIKFKLLKKRP